MLGRSMLACGVATALLVACSGGDGSGFPNGKNGNGSGDGGNTPGFGNNGNGSGDAGDLSQCATSSSTPTPVPVSLVFMFDKSGSMSQNSKWTACGQGLSSFFADAASAGVAASLQFFPSASNECSTNVYAAPAVSMRALPDATTFSSVIASNSPGGGTPTLPALTGAIMYAQSVQSSSPGTKVAVVLVTDGQPNDCSSTVQAVANEASSVAATIPTFVIGVGNTGNLDAIAAAGGTGQATIVSTNNPTQTEQDFQKALSAIRGLAVSCTYQLPPPPQGQQFDKSKVNVIFTPTNGSPQTLTYNQDCTGGTGWHYDDPKNPKMIELCSGTCSAVQGSSGKVDIVLGCATNGTIPN